MTWKRKTKNKKTQKIQNTVQRQHEKRRIGDTFTCVLNIILGQMQIIKAFTSLVVQREFRRDGISVFVALCLKYQLRQKSERV